MFADVLADLAALHKSRPRGTELQEASEQIAQVTNQVEAVSVGLAAARRTPSTPWPAR